MAWIIFCGNFPFPVDTGPIGYSVYFFQLCIVDQCNVFELLDDMPGILCMYLINLMMKHDWHCYDPEDWWAHGGHSFWCAGPYPTDRYQWTGTHGDMISSDLHGAEEPIRWLLDGRDRTTLWWATAREGRRTFHPGHFGRARPRGNHPLQMGGVILMDRMPPWESWTLTGACGSVLRSFHTCGILEEPWRGQRLVF